MSAREAARRDILEEIGEIDHKWAYYNENYDVRLCHIFSNEKLDFQA